MPRFINPFSDVGFKKIFGQEMNKELLIEFLNDLLCGEKQIRDIRFMDKEHYPFYKDGRRGIYDIACLSEDGERFIVEMQNNYQGHFRERALYYLSQAIAYQGEKGSTWDFELKAVYGVFFLNFPLEGKLRTDAILTDRDTGEQFSDKLRFIFIEFPSFRKDELECETDFERWIYVLKNMETLDKLPFKGCKSVFGKLEAISDLASLSREDRIRYDASLKAYRDYYATISTAEKKGREEGREEGISEGLMKGREEGWTKGLDAGWTKGKEEGRLEIARNLKSKGLSVDLISESTGLPVEEIDKL